MQAASERSEGDPGALLRALREIAERRVDEVDALHWDLRDVITTNADSVTTLAPDERALARQQEPLATVAEERVAAIEEEDQ